MPDKLRVGYVGLGVMGKPMARNLLRAGFPLTVHNRSRGAVDELAAGGRDGRHLARRGRPGERRRPHLPSGARRRRGRLPRRLRRARGRRRRHHPYRDEHDRPEHASEARRTGRWAGAGYLDAPVSGGSTGAQNATLTIMVGGEAATLEKARPVLEAVGKQIYHLGPVGAGATAKLVNNMLGAINLAGAIEALVLGQKAGLDPRQLAEVINNSSGASRSFAVRRPGDPPAQLRAGVHDRPSAQGRLPGDRPRPAARRPPPRRIARRAGSPGGARRWAREEERLRRGPPARAERGIEIKE